MIDELLSDCRERMARTVEATRGELSTIRTGRASPQLLDRITVDYYGAQTPLRQLANVAASEARLLTITPFDKSAIGSIEKAITESDIGLTPSNDGNLIRLSVPELTEERRRELVKVAHGIAEDGRISVRGARREAIGDLKELKKDGEVGEDSELRAESEVQKLTDGSVAQIDSMLEAKEAEILEV